MFPHLPVSSVGRVLLLPLAATILWWPLDAGAQAVSGVVQESETGDPLPTVVITLLDGDGRVHGRTLSDVRGRFSLSAPGPGRYGLRAERIGRRSVEVAPLEVGSGEEVVRELVMFVEAISLEGIEVVGDARCRLRPDEGVALARVWDQARIALQVEALSREAQALRFRLRNFTRELSPDLRRVVDEEEETSSTFAREPYRSAPVAGLMRDGWIQADPRDGSWDYFAPDAAALLSDSFQEGHCFRLVRDEEHPGLLGLGFEPVGRSSTPGVEGALWLEEATSELRFLTYRYTNVPPVAGAARRLPRISPEAMGGRVEFVQLPGGAWVVSRWYIRAPLLRVATRTVLGRAQEEVTLGGVSEIGGEVLEVRGRDGDVIALESMEEPSRPSGLALIGVVTDSISGEPLEGATVFVSGVDTTARTDQEGRFELTELPPGTYFVGFSHPRLDDLGLDGGLPARVEVPQRGGATVELTTPSFGTVLVARCAAEGMGEGGAVAGTVRTGDEVPVPEAEVVLRWGQNGDEGRMVTEADAAGGFLFCGVPAGEPASLLARFLGLEGPAERLALDGGEGVVQDLRLDLDGLASEHADRMELRTEPGRILSDNDPIRIEGRVEDWSDGRPVADAVIRLVEAELATTTGPDGRFVFGEVNPGTYRFEIEHIAYGIRHEILSLEGGRLVHIAVRLPTRAIALEGFTVTATPRTPVEEIRRRSGTRRDIVAGAELARAELRGERVIDVVRRMPGVQVTEGGEGEGNLPFGSVCVELRRATRGILTGGGCDMVLVIMDAARVSGGIEDLGPFLAGLPVADFESIELLSPMQAGTIYGLSGSSGAIVLHSRGRGPYLDPERNRE